MNKFLLSIIVPTRNRQNYVIKLVESILEGIRSPEIEIVVSDTSDENTLMISLSKYGKDCRLNYKYSAPPVSSIENFNKSMELATGEYICIIGDDDGVNLDILAFALWAKENGVDVIRPNPTAHYFWPDMAKIMPKKIKSGTLMITSFTGDEELVDVSRQLEICLQNACLEYYNTKIPKAYHGIVKRSIFESIRSKTGHYFAATSPDIYSAICIALCKPVVYSIDYPITIGGIGAKSEAGAISSGNRSGPFSTIRILKDNLGYVWEPTIPKINSVDTIWADSAIKAIRDNDIDLGSCGFNWPLLYARCMIKYPKYYKESISACIVSLKTFYRNRMLYFVVMTIYCAMYCIMTMIRKTISRIYLKLLSKIFESNSMKWEDVGDIRDASDNMMRFLHTRKPKRLFPLVAEDRT